jgi:hypothetical protein
MTADRRIDDTIAISNRPLGIAANRFVQHRNIFLKNVTVDAYKGGGPMNIFSVTEGLIDGCISANEAAKWTYPGDFTGCKYLTCRNTTFQYGANRIVSTGITHHLLFENTLVAREYGTRYQNVATSGGGYDLSVIRDIVFLNNEIRTFNGDPNFICNWGEGILFEGIGAFQDNGTVSSASTASVTDSSKTTWSGKVPTQTDPNMPGSIITLLSGPQSGEWRTIVSTSADTVGVNPNWSTPPAFGTRYAITSW